MATLDLSRAATRIDMTDYQIVQFGTAEQTEDDSWSFDTGRSDDLQLDGTGMTFDSTGRALKGTVNSIGIDLGDNDFDNPDVLITGLKVAASTLDDGHVAFWRSVLGGNDTIIGPRSGTGHQLFGDGYLGWNKGIGGNDWIELGPIRTTAVGDVWSVGGQNGGATAISFKGGNDVIVTEGSLDNQQIVGDASFVNAAGTLTGGNDTITLRGPSSMGASTVVGDATVVAGTAGKIATVIGGNDAISVLEGTLVVMYGDVDQQLSDSFVRGGDDTLSGSTGRDFIVGDVNLIGSNRMVGGHDLIMGNGGDDEIYGDFYGAGAGGHAEAGNDTIYGGSGKDTIYGDGTQLSQSTGGNDRLYGESGNDSIYAGTGNDTLDGGTGNDALYGGVGDDVYVANEAGDSIFEGADAGIDTVFTTHLDVSLANNVENLTFTGTGNFVGDGNILDNVIRGAGGADTLYGGKGNDQLHGGARDDKLVGGEGEDVLNGGAGADYLEGGDGFDIASYAGSEQRVFVSLDGSVSASGDAIGDVFSFIEGLRGSSYNDRLAGNADANRLEGGNGRDELFGQDGDDVLVGGKGVDWLSGGGDNDRFVFNAVTDSGTTSSSRDLIVDFVHGEDLIDLSALDANTRTASNDVFKLLGKGSAASAVSTGKIGWYQIDQAGTANDKTILRINNDADSAIDMTIELKGLVNLTAGDFVL